MTLVAGIDSSTQSCKVVVRDALSGALVRSGSAPHPDTTEVDPECWWEAAQAAIASAGGLDDVGALSVGAQQHGMVCLDETGAVVRPALLWNDLRSGPAAAALVDELGGAGWAQAVGVVPVASFTITKLRWLAEHEPGAASRTAAVCLPHDWLTWKLLGARGIGSLSTDRSDASGTGYWSSLTDRYRLDLMELAFGRRVEVPRVLGPSASPGRRAEAVIGPGAGDNASAALVLAPARGDVVVSVGTSGVVSASCPTLIPDSSGTVAGFADATGQFLPLVCTVNAARVLQATARMLQVDQEHLARLALSAPPGADGLVLLPYLEGERTPNLPDASGELHGLRLKTATPAHLARAAFEGVLCGLAEALDAVEAQGVPVERIHLIGGASRSEALRRIAPTILGRPVLVPPPGEYVADGAAYQAAWVLQPDEKPPVWPIEGSLRYEADPVPQVRSRYGEVRDQYVARFLGGG